MKTQINFGWQMLVVLLIAGGVIYAILKGKGAVKKLVTETLNPVSDQNIAYRGSNAVTQAIVGNDVDTVGTAAYNAIHDDCGNLKWPWQSSKDCTVITGIGGPVVLGRGQFRPVARPRIFGTSEGE